MKRRTSGTELLLATRRQQDEPPPRLHSVLFRLFSKEDILDTFTSEHTEPASDRLPAFLRPATWDKLPLWQHLVDRHIAPDNIQREL